MGITGGRGGGSAAGRAAICSTADESSEAAGCDRMNGKADGEEREHLRFAPIGNPYSERTPSQQEQAIKHRTGDDTQHRDVMCRRL